jgi:hypothetical protein
MLKVIRKKHEINRNQICCIFYRKIADIISVCSELRVQQEELAKKVK